MTCVHDTQKLKIHLSLYCTSSTLGIHALLVLCADIICLHYTSRTKSGSSSGPPGYRSKAQNISTINTSHDCKLRTDNKIIHFI